ncbi:Pentatricopeptide repeat [Macleaya cordata]|uniref:Pentatricopeptide repeat n=1 Tax=Macleaya cordata TaxID=56857 RepID=A0A200QVR9_MACCD|nr:Pentatricopeptide repeat [Macleaya cordata]
MKLLPFQLENLTTITIKPTQKNPTELLKELNSSISNLSRSHQYSEALQVFNQIHSSHILKPDNYTFASTLTACANLFETSFGNQVHSLVVRAGFKSYPHVCNTLLSLYAKSNDLNSVNRVFYEIATPDDYSWTTLLSAHAKSGQIEHALNLFDKIPRRSVAVWNAVITGSIENGYLDIAFEMFLEMHRLGVRHDQYSFASAPSLCSEPQLLDFGKQVHSLVIKTGFFVRVSVINAHLTMYFNCGTVKDAFRVFEEAKTSELNQITFNAMIAGLVSRERNLEALLMFKEMKESCFEPTERTFVSVLSSSSSMGKLEIGQQVHAQAVKMGFQDFTSVSNAAITMYSNCGDLAAACLVFERLEDKDLVSWNSIVTGYVQGSEYRSAIMTFLQMQIQGIEPDDFTVGSLLACSGIRFTEMIQAFVTKNGLILNTQVCNALISAYSKHGKIENTHLIFAEMPSRNLISWNSIISGCLFNGLPERGLEIFCNLQKSKLKPCLYTLSTVLSICSSISNLRYGKEVHGYVVRSEFGSETSLGNALITMYAKCGILDRSARVFGSMPKSDLVSWNAMISAYGQHGEGKEAVSCFNKMQELGDIKPDQATFTAILFACSHAGLIDEGCRVFSSMVEEYGIEPGMNQYSCLVDLLARAGHLDDAEKLINSMPFRADSSIWWPLLSACAAHGNVRLGKISAGFILEAEPDNPTVYVLLSNIYANAGKWEEKANVRKLMSENGVIKQPGYSWVESHKVESER